MIKFILLIGALTVAAIIPFAQYRTATEAKNMLCQQVAEKRDAPMREEMNFLRSEFGGGK